MIVLNSIFNAADRAGRFTELQITILYFVTSAFYCPATYYRLKNIGTNPWWCLLNAVPLVSFLLMARCVIFPKGYADTQSMDKPATIMIAIVFATFVIAAVCVAVYYRHGFSDF